jgi:hypothetical protein
MSGTIRLSRIQVFMYVCACICTMIYSPGFLAHNLRCKYAKHTQTSCCHHSHVFCDGGTYGNDYNGSHHYSQSHKCGHITLSTLLAPFMCLGLLAQLHCLVAQSAWHIYTSYNY